MQLKRKRLPNGKFITVRLIESSAEDIAKADPNDIWKTGDGRLILPKDMDLMHIVNCMRTLESRDALIKKSAGLTDEEARAFTARAHPIYSVLAAELARRMRGQASEPAPGADRIPRAFDL